MGHDIPEGWQKVRGGYVEAGDRIRTANGWTDADNIGRDQYRELKSAVGHPAVLYEVVIREVPHGAASQEPAPDVRQGERH